MGTPTSDYDNTVEVEDDTISHLLTILSK